MADSAQPGAVPPEVLIVDDEDLVREMLRDALEAENHTVAEAADGKEAVEKILALRPRIVVSDVRMPEMNGYEVLHEIRRNHPELASIPFIFLTGLSDKSYISAAYKIGADDYLTKPVDLDVLCMKIGAMLQRLGPPPLPRAERPPESVAASAEDLSPEFRRKLEELATNRRQSITSSVRLLNLEEYREKFGDRWAKLQPVAMTLAESVLRKHLGPDEVYSRSGDDGYMVLLPDCDEDTARRRVELIVRDIREHMVGESGEDLSDLNVSADVVDLGDVVDESAADISAALLADIFERRETERKERSPPPRAKAPDPKTWFVGQLAQHYRPLWNAKRQMVVAVQCVPVRTTPYGVLVGRTVLHGGAEDPWAVELDAFMVKQATELLRAQAKLGRKLLASVPVHYRTLTGDRVAEIEKLLQAMPENVLKSRLILEIVGVPEHHGVSGTRGALAFARRYSDFVSVETAPDDPHIGLLRDAGVRLLQHELAPAPVGDADVASMRAIQRFARDAQALGLQARMHAVDSLGRFKAARNAGVLFMSGRVIGRTDAKPMQPYLLPESTIAGR